MSPLDLEPFEPIDLASQQSICSESLACSEDLPCSDELGVGLTVFTPS